MNGPKTALLLLNFGTPGAPTKEAVRSYLIEVLSDLTLRSLPKLLQQVLIRSLFVPWRLNDTVERYRSTWTEHGSLLSFYSKKLCDALSSETPSCHTVLAMKYGTPSIVDTLEPLFPFNHLIVLSLFPIELNLSRLQAREVQRSLLFVAFGGKTICI